MDGSNYGERGGVINRLLSSPGAIATVLVAIGGQVLFSTVYQIRTNDRLESRIEANELAVRDLREAIRSLSERSDRNDNVLSTKLEALDSHGTRQMDAIATTAGRAAATAERLAERVDAVDRRISDLEAHVVAQIKAQLDVDNEVIKRLDEQQMRIIQALDNTYNLLNEYIRDNPGRKELHNPPGIRGGAGHGG